MRYVFYLIFGIILLSLQTAVLSRLPVVISFYDILIAFVVYFSLFRSLSAGMSVVLVIGFMMDMVSGAPNGIYMATYMTVFLLFRNITVYIHAKETVLFTVCMVIGVSLENLAFGAILGHSDMPLLLSVQALQTLVVQLIWVFLTASLICRIFTIIFAGVDHLRSLQ